MCDRAVMLTNDFRGKNVSEKVIMYFLDQRQDCVSLGCLSHVFILFYFFRSIVSPSALYAVVE